MSLLGAETNRFTDRIFGNTLIRFGIWVVVLGYVFPGLFTDAFKLAEWMDDHQFYSWETSDRETLLHWGQIPMWNPFWCGGTAGAGAPEDPFFGPDFLFRLVFGVAHGRRLALGFLVVMGMEGMYRLARTLDSSAVGAIVAAVVYATCDKFIGFIHDGWVNFLGFELIPWAVMCFFRGFRTNGWRLFGGFIIAWILMSAGTYPTPFTLLALFYLFAVYFARGLLSKDKRSAILPTQSLFVMGVVAIGLALVKLIPMVLFLKQFPRVFTPVETNSMFGLLTPFWDRYALVCILAFVALGFADRVAGVFFFGAIIFFSFACGDFGPYSPFHMVKLLPIFGQLRIPDRYMVLVLFFMCVAASRGATRVEDTASKIATAIWDVIALKVRHMRGEARTAAAATFVGIAAMVMARTLYQPALDVLETVKIRPSMMYTLEPPRTMEQPFKQSRGNRRDAHVFTAANLGSLYCVAGNPVPESALLRGDLEQEEYPEDPSKASVKRLDWSPQAITLDVDAKEATTIRINQNWSSHWGSDVGTVREEQKLLVIDVPAGKNIIHVRYRDYTTYFCLAVSLATLIGLLRHAARKTRDFVKAERAGWRTLPLWPWSPRS
jgi:hypothetical protein